MSIPSGSTLFRCSSCCTPCCQLDSATAVYLTFSGITYTGGCLGIEYDLSGLNGTFPVYNQFPGEGPVCSPPFNPSEWDSDYGATAKLVVITYSGAGCTGTATRTPGDLIVGVECSDLGVWGVLINEIFSWSGTFAQLLAGAANQNTTGLCTSGSVTLTLSHV